jgi:hypothetical protein
LADHAVKELLLVEVVAADHQERPVIEDWSVPLYLANHITVLPNSHAPIVAHSEKRRGGLAKLEEVPHFHSLLALALEDCEMQVGCIANGPSRDAVNVGFEGEVKDSLPGVELLHLQCAHQRERPSQLLVEAELVHQINRVSPPGCVARDPKQRLHSAEVPLVLLAAVPFRLVRAAIALRICDEELCGLVLSRRCVRL